MKWNRIHAMAGLAILFPAVLFGSIDFQSQQPIQLSGPGSGERLLLRDLDGDGHLDVVITPQRGQQDVFADGLNILTGDGSGQFPEGGTLAAGISISGLVMADFNGDGILDLATTERVLSKGAAYPPCGNPLPGIPVYTGTGDGEFIFRTCLSAADIPAAAAAGDFNEDGHVDLVVVNSPTSSVGATQRDVWLFRGAGDGSFAPGEIVFQCHGNDIVVADFNGDGHADLAIGNEIGIFVYGGNGAGGFTAVSTASPRRTRRLEVGDLNGDGAPDLAATGSLRQDPDDDILWIGVNDGTGKFPLSYTYPADGHPICLAVGDLNGDGFSDIVTANNLSGTVSVFFSSRSANLLPPVTFPAGPFPTAVGIGDLNEDGNPDLAVAGANLGEDGLLTVLLQVQGTSSPVSEQFFPQFVTGGGVSSNVVLYNPDPEQELSLALRLSDSQGAALDVTLNGQEIHGVSQLTLAPETLAILRTDGLGEVRLGSACLAADGPVAGSVQYGGEFGRASVGSSDDLGNGFLSPVKNSSLANVKTGIAWMNLEAHGVNLALELLSKSGTLLSTAQISLGAGGHQALFVEEIPWASAVDFSEFSGLIKGQPSGRVAAVTLQTWPAEYATMPVGPLLDESQQGSASALYFPQMGNGQGLVSRIMILNPSAEAANARVLLRQDDGNPLALSLNGQAINGEISVSVPGWGLFELESDGLGPVKAGSAVIESERALLGVILYSSDIGVAGVGNSPPMTAFAAPIDRNQQASINTGIAIANQEDAVNVLTLELWSAAGTLLATAQDQLPARGHTARFLDELNWSPTVDTSSFEGVLKVRGSGKIAGTAIQLSPGRFATLPVVPIPQQ